MNEMSKIEEVARAMCEEMGVIWGGPKGEDDPDFLLVKITYLSMARTAIEAMRDANLIYAVLEPRTEADEIAGRREFYGDSGAWLSLWNIAIDTALKE